MAFRYLSIIALAAMALSVAHAASVHPALDSYLLTYMPNATINSAVFYNTTLNGASYIIMQLNANNNYVVIENSSASYTMLTNITLIDSVLTPFLTSKYYPNNSTLSYLNSTMESYRRYGYANISDCLVETGLNTGATCTLANECQSCTTVPNCHKALSDNGGPNSTFGYGIMNFSAAYDKLNSSFNSYFSLLASINRSNAGIALSGMSSDTDNISTILSTINQNPLFPPPQNFPTTCNPATPPNKQPWYCVAVGYCPEVVQNITALYTIKGDLSSLEAGIPSPSGIESISSNSSAAAQGYIDAYLSTENGASYNQLISSLTPKINGIENISNKLLARYDNATLRASLSSLENQFTIVKSAGVNQTISISNATLQGLLANATESYDRANSSYNQIYGISQNNTAALLADQLSYPQIPTKLAVLANEQQQINTKLDSGISSNDIGALLPKAQDIKIESTLFIAPLTVAYTVKLLDTPFIDAMLASSNAYIPQKIASAPMYAALQTLIIDLLVILVVFIITYLRVIKKGKLKNNKMARNVWIAVFVVLIILALVDTYGTYAYAQQGNSFLPFNYFMNSVKASNTAYIALNGSAATNPSTAQCASTIEGYLNASKSVKIIKLENYSCVSGGNISVLGIGCYNNILASGDPVIFISQSGQSNITYKGLYGTVLYANGNVTYGKYCTLGTLFRNVQ